jgi:hypothetical protein
MGNDPLTVPVGGDTPPAPQPAPEPAPAPTPQPYNGNKYDGYGETKPVSGDAETATGNKYDGYGDSYINAQKALLKSSLIQSADVQADAHARVLQLADKFGVSPDLVASNPGIFNATVKWTQADADHLLKNHPELATWLSNPDNAKVGQDDIPLLRSLDLAINSYAHPKDDPSGLLPQGYSYDANGETITGPALIGNRGTFSGVEDLRQQMTLRSQVETAQQGIAQETLGNWGGGFATSVISSLYPFHDSGFDAAMAEDARQNPGFGSALKRFAGQTIGSIPYLMVGGELAKAGTSLSQVANLRFLEKPATSAIGKLAQKTVAAVANPNAVGFEKRVQQFAQTALAVAPLNAQQFAKQQETEGTLNAGIDFLLNTTIMGAMPGGVQKAFLPGVEPAVADGYISTAKRLLMEHGFPQAGQGAVLAVAGALHRSISGQDPDALDPARLAPEIIQSAALQGIAGTIFGMPAALHERYTREASNASMALANADRGARIMQLVQESMTGKRAPERLDQLIHEYAQKSGPTTYRVDEFDAAIKSQGLDPQEAANIAGAGPEYTVAKAHGGEFQIPLEGWARLGRNVKDPTALIQTMRQVPGAKSAEEAQVFFESAPQDISAIAAEAKKIADDVNHMRDPSAERVYQDILSQRLANGADKSEAEHEARLQTAFFEVAGQRFHDNAAKTDTTLLEPADPWSLYSRHKLRIEQEIPGVVQGQYEVLDTMLDRLRTGEVPTARDVGGESLIDFLRKKGLTDPQGDLTAMGANEATKPGERHLVRAGGIDPDVAAEAAVEAGYIKERDVNQLYEAIQNELAGRPVFKVGEENPVQLREKTALDDLSSYLREIGVDVKSMDNAAIKAAMESQGLQQEGAVSEAAQTFRQGQGDKTRGLFQVFTGGQKKITLTADKNISTFLHEGAHFFLEAFGDLAERADAPESIKKDYRAILDWLAVKDRAGIKAEHHERFADAFLNYTHKGEAPSVGLRASFFRFRTWLLDLFRKGEIQKIAIPKEIKDVFDRMLATDREIAIAEEANGVQALFATADKMGVTAPAFEAYRAAGEKGHMAGVEQLQKEVFADKDRQRRVWYKAEKERVGNEVEAEVNARPVYAAMRALQDGVDAKGEPLPEEVRRLNKEQIVTIYGKASLDRLPGPKRGRGRNNNGRVVYEEGGIALEEAAIRYGFHSGDELVTSLINAPNREKVIAAETQREMTRLHGDIMTDGSLHEAAIAAVLNDENGQVLMAELEALKKLERDSSPVVKEALKEQADVHKMAVKEERAALKEEARQKKIQKRTAIENMRESIPTLNTMRQVAEKIVRNQTHLQLDPEVYRVSAVKAGREAFNAFGKEDYAAAGAAKQREILSYALHRAAINYKAQIEKAFRYIKRFELSATRERIGKAGGWEWTVYNDKGAVVGTADSEQGAKELAGKTPDSTWELTSSYLDQIDGIRAGYQFSNVDPRTLRRKQQLLLWVQDQQRQGANVIIPPDVLNEARRVNWKELTVDEMLGIRDAIKNIETLATKKNTLLKLAAGRRLQERVGELVASGSENAPPRKPGKTAKGFFSGFLRFLDNADAAHTKLSTQCRICDGDKDGGIFWETFARPINDCDVAETQLRHDITQDLKNLRDEWGKDTPLVKGTVFNAVYAGKHIPEVGDTLSLMNRIFIALNWGTESNRERVLTSGTRGKPWTLEQVKFILDSLDEKDWKFISGIWKVVGRYASDIKAQEQRLEGVAPEMLEGLPIETKFGTVMGSYFGIKYNPEYSTGAQTPEVTTDDVSYSTSPSTRDGYVNTRVKSVPGRPLLFEERALTSHLNELTHRLTHEDTLQDIGKILRSKDFQAMMQEKYGKKAFDIISDSILAVAKGDLTPVIGIEKGLSYIRRGTSIAVQGYNVMSGVMQIPGITQSMVRIGPKWWGKAFERFSADPLSYAKWAMEKDPFLKQRGTTFLREAREATGKIGFKGSMGPFTDHIFTMMHVAQFMVDLPTWGAAYEKALAENPGDEKLAIDIARQTVIDTQGSGSIKDLAAVQRNGELGKILTNFYGFFSTTYQLQKVSIARTRAFGGVGKLATDFLLLYSLPIVMTAALREALRRARGAQASADTKDWQSILARLGKDHLSYLMSTMVGLREFSGLLSGYPYNGPPETRIVSVLGNVAVQIEQGQADRALLHSILASGGILAHLPTMQIQRFIDGILDNIHSGSFNPANVAFGTPSKR